MIISASAWSVKTGHGFMKLHAQIANVVAYCLMSMK